MNRVKVLLLEPYQIHQAGDGPGPTPAYIETVPPGEVILVPEILARRLVLNAAAERAPDDAQVTYPPQELFYRTQATTMKDWQVLEFLKARLVNNYGESPNVDFVRTLEKIAKEVRRVEQ